MRAAPRYPRAGGGSISSWRNHAAFTLVELLVVVAIIAVLASLMMPAIQRALDSGRASVCRGNLRQIGQAMHMHVHDMDGWLPFFGDPVNFGRPPGSGGNETVGTQWDVQIMPYLGIDWTWGSIAPPPELGTRPTVFYCPGHEAYPNFVRALSYNYSQRIGQNRRGSRSLELIEDPLRTVLVVDAVHASTEPWDNRSTWLGRGRTASNRFTENTLPTRGLFAYRHQGLKHILFADAHIEGKPLGPTGYPSGVRLANGMPVYP